MYTEFIITVTIPAVGLFLIVVFYYVRLWQIRQSAVVVDFLDTEMGPLQKQDKSLEDTDAAAVRPLALLGTSPGLGRCKEGATATG